MLSETIRYLLVTFWPLLLAGGLAIHLLRNKYNNGLHKYPGPPLAAYTNWWRFFDVYSGKAQYTHIDLHRQYGDVVRLGPNILSFADPRALKAIYSPNKGVTKSYFYTVQRAIARGRPLQSLFSALDENYHARYKRCVNSAFTMSSLIEYEPLVDSTISVFIQETRRRFCDTHTTVNFARWLQYFAFDVVGEVTWSKRLGFVERNEDIDGIVKFLGDFLMYASYIGQMPFLDLLFRKNPILLQLQKWGINNQVFPVTRFAQTQSAQRAAEMDKIRETGTFPHPPPSSSQNPDTNNRPTIDLLMKFTQAQHDHADFMTDAQVLTSCTSMIFAGSETTAISLSAVFYYLAKHPRAYAKLMRELDDPANLPDNLHPHNLVSWSDAQKLPYLDAVILESFRLFPAAGLLLERVVGPHGLDVLGLHIPPGTIVGCNAWVVHRRPDLFSADLPPASPSSPSLYADVDTFRPERWLPCSTLPAETDAARIREMRATLFHFGAGPRTCIGKNLALLEIYKLVPTFLRNFEVLLENRPRQTSIASAEANAGVQEGEGNMEGPLERGDSEEWKTHNAWFVRQTVFPVRFRERAR